MLWSLQHWFRSSFSSLNPATDRWTTFSPGEFLHSSSQIDYCFAHVLKDRSHRFCFVCRHAIWYVVSILWISPVLSLKFFPLFNLHMVFLGVFWFAIHWKPPVYSSVPYTSFCSCDDLFRVYSFVLSAYLHNSSVFLPLFQTSVKCISPQYHTKVAELSIGVLRLLFSLDFLPLAHDPYLAIFFWDICKRPLKCSTSTGASISP